MPTDTTSPLNVSLILNSASKVVKARNKLDARVYAVKKVRLGNFNKPENQKIMREVTTLSRLHHKHIVRYYQAWVEGGRDDSDSDDESSWEEGLGSSSALGQNMTDGVPSRDQPGRPRPSPLDDLASDGIFGREFSVSPPSPEQESTQGGALPGFAASMAPDLGLSRSSSGNVRYLYIQMEYCQRILSDVIQTQILDEGEVWRMLRQLLEGLEPVPLLT